MKKILVLASTYPRWENDSEPAFVESLCKELAIEYEVHVLVPHYRNALVYEEKDNITVHRFRYCLSALETLAYQGGILANLKRNKLNYLLIPLFILFQSTSLYWLNKRFAFNVVHAHWIIPQGFSAAVIKFFSNNKYKILITSHGGDLYALKGRIFRILKSWIINKSAHMTVVSAAMKKFCDDMGIDGDKISVCSMGVDLQNRFVKHAAFSERNDIIFVGRLVEKKGVKYLIEAMETVVKAFPSVRLDIIGDGPERGYLEKLAVEKNIKQNIAFTGAVPNHEIPAYLNRAKIAAMPSVVASDGDQEGLGLVAVEAMGCGCAVVASNLPAVRDVISDGITGVMVKPASATSIADAIIKLLTDNDFAESIAKQGREYVINKYNWQNIGSRYREVIENI